jgi:hypothetical protein
LRDRLKFDVEVEAADVEECIFDMKYYLRVKIKVPAGAKSLTPAEELLKLLDEF